MDMILELLRELKGQKEEFKKEEKVADVVMTKESIEGDDGSSHVESQTDKLNEEVKEEDKN